MSAFSALKPLEKSCLAADMVVLADALDALSHVAKESIHLTFTSPPYYNARAYAQYESYSAYLEFMRRVFAEVHRVTREGRFLVVNTSPVIEPRLNRRCASKRYPIPFDLHGVLVGLGWEFMEDIVWVKPEGSVPNRVGGFFQHRKPLGYKPNCVTEYVMVYRKRTDKLLDWNMRQYSLDVVERSRVGGVFERTNVWRISPCASRVHSAVFPLELCRRVICFYSFVGDVVFDPFAGSGTVGRVAALLGRGFFLVEREPLYVEYMKSLFGELGVLAKFLDLAEFAKL